MTLYIRRREFITFLGGGAAWPVVLRAQQQRGLPVIGFLSSGSPRSFSTFVAAFRQGVREQGHIEGRDVSIEYRWAEGEYDQLGMLASDLVQNRVALIAATGGVISAKAAMKVTSTIPIVFVIGCDPVKVGLVSKLSRPDNNATGSSVFSLELATKRLEMLRLALGVRNERITIAVVVNPGSITTDIEIEDTINAAKQLNKFERGKTTEQMQFNIIVLTASTESEISDAVLSASRQRATALLVSADPFFTVRRRQVVTLVAQHGIPAMYPWREYVKDGGLMSYGTELTWGYHLIGLYAGRILKGEKPRDLPVQLPTKFDLVLNLKTAKALGLAVPPNMLALADEVIE
jgi:putative tryptophan/tyrosine transport system substrate-binding protein